MHLAPNSGALMPAGQLYIAIAVIILWSGLKCTAISMAAGESSIEQCRGSFGTASWRITGTEKTRRQRKHRDTAGIPQAWVSPRPRGPKNVRQILESGAKLHPSLLLLPDFPGALFHLPEKHKIHWKMQRCSPTKRAQYLGNFPSLCNSVK